LCSLGFASLYPTYEILLIAALRQASRFRKRTLRDREKYHDYHADIQLGLDTDTNRMSYKSKIKI
jgi:hypothetical protein